MEGNANILDIITEDSLKYCHGMVVIKIKDKPSTFIWLWSKMKINVFEMPPINIVGCLTLDEKLTKNEISLSCNVVNIFQVNEDTVYILDREGALHGFQFVNNDPNSPIQFMDVEDLFNSPTSCDTCKWKEISITHIKNCDYVVDACHFSMGLAVLVMKDDHLTVHVYSLPEFRFKFFFDIDSYNSQGAVLSSCEVASLSPLLRRHFQDNLEVLDSEIITIGLQTGIILWFCSNNSTKGPFVLFSTHQEVQNMYWIKDAGNDLTSHLVTVLSSGSIIIFGAEKTVFLPESVKTSWGFGNHLITSNLVDCYNNELKLAGNIEMNSVLLPVKGVCAITELSDSNNLLLAATVHGSVYCLNVRAKPTETPAHFTIPEEHLLDKIFLQTKSLESVYKHLSEEDSMLKAISTSVAAGSVQGLFQLSLKIISDDEFCLVSRLTKTGVVFSHKLWLANVEVTKEHGYRESSYSRFTKDFSHDSELQLNAKQNFSIGDVVYLELMLLSETQQPIIIVPAGKIEVDAGYLMVTQVPSPNVPDKKDSLEDILINLNSEPPMKRIVQERKLYLKVPDAFDINTVLPSLLSNVQHRISKDEWDKLAGGKKYSIQVNVNRMAILIHLEVESRELTITCCDIQICHHVKDAILRRLHTSQDMHISENIALEVQALSQEFEIETFKDGVDFQILEALRKRLRTTLSCHFLH